MLYYYYPEYCNQIEVLNLISIILWSLDPESKSLGQFD